MISLTIRNPGRPPRPANDPARRSAVRCRSSPGVWLGVAVFAAGQADRLSEMLRDAGELGRAVPQALDRLELLCRGRGDRLLLARGRLRTLLPLGQRLGDAPRQVRDAPGDLGHALPGARGP